MLCWRLRTLQQVCAGCTLLWSRCPVLHVIHNLKDIASMLLSVQWLQVTVIRNGKSQEIELAELLVGDVLCYGAGDILAADGIIFQASDVK